MSGPDYVVAMIVVSVISIIGSLIVVSTPLIFPSMRYRLFMQIISFISIGDIIGNFTYLFPYRPSTGNWWCDVQAFTTLTGYPIEWLWTVILVFFLYTLALTGQVPKRTWYFHLISWTLPVILAFCSLITSKFTHTGQYADVCSVNTTRIAMIYHGVVFYGLLIICFVIMILLFCLLLYHEYILKDVQADSVTFTIAKRALMIYPCLMFLFWFPHGISASLNLKRNAKNVYDTLLMWKSLHGLAVTLVFFGQSDEACRVWYNFLRQLCGLSTANRSDSRFSTASNSSAIVDVNDILPGRETQRQFTYSMDRDQSFLSESPMLTTGRGSFFQSLRASFSAPFVIAATTTTAIAPPPLASSAESTTGIVANTNADSNLSNSNTHGSNTAGNPPISRDSSRASLDITFPHVTIPIPLNPQTQLTTNLLSAFSSSASLSSMASSVTTNNPINRNLHDHINNVQGEEVHRQIEAEMIEQP